jgi:hypothetical protein
MERESGGASYTCTESADSFPAGVLFPDPQEVINIHIQPVMAIRENQCLFIRKAFYQQFSEFQLSKLRIFLFRMKLKPLILQLTPGWQPGNGNNEF